MFSIMQRSLQPDFAQIEGVRKRKFKLGASKAATSEAGTFLRYPGFAFPATLVHLIKRFGKRLLPREGLKDLAHTLRFFLIHREFTALDVVAEHRQSARPFSFAPRRMHFVASSILNQFSFELGKREQHIQGETPERRRGVECLSHRYERCVMFIKNSNNRGKVKQRTAEPVHLIYHYTVNKLAGDISQ